MGQQFGDTTMTKVFVGGLAWETQKDALRDHFEKYGDILEAVIISDKATGRSKGYGFVTFREAESAKKACEDPSPVINGRKSNCNLASVGARRTPKSSPPATPSPVIVPPRQAAVRGPPVPVQHQWYYATQGGTGHPSPMAGQQHYHGVVPYYPPPAYGYSPSYMGYNAVNRQYYPAAAQSGMVSPNGMYPMYQVYPYHHQSQSIGAYHGHYFPHSIATSAPIATLPTTVVSKPVSILPPPSVCMVAEQMTGCS